MKLFSAKDLDRVEKAMAAKEQISLTRTMGDVSQTVSTSPELRFGAVPCLSDLRKPNGTFTQRNISSP